MHSPMSAKERATIRRMRRVLGMRPRDICIATGRSKNAVRVVLKGRGLRAPRPPGRPPSLSPRGVDCAVRVLRRLVRQARGRREVTLAMVRTEAGLSASVKTLRAAFHARNIFFRRLRSKPKLTVQDKKARYEFAQAFKDKPVAWWLRHVHLAIDLKTFPVYLNDEGRARAANREIRGAYREPRQGLDEGYVIVNRVLRYNPGTKSVRIAAGMGSGKVRLWHDVGEKWNGEAAAQLYGGPLLHALKRAHPGKRTFRILEDNDPTGFKSRKGEAAKAESGIHVFAIPPRSPDLSVCDYALWKAVTRQMRKTEAAFPRGRRESRKAFIARLRRAAMSLPRSFIDKSIGDMRRRCQRCFARRGGFFEEGGRARGPRRRGPSAA